MPIIPYETITRVPPIPTKTTPLLFVHGILHGAWCFDTFWLPFLAQAGYQVTAMSLRGHGTSPMPVGKSLRWASIADYVQDVRVVAQQIERDTGKRPVLIGHSMGGLIVQKYIEKYPTSGAVLLASVPVNGALKALLRATLRHPLTIAKATLRRSYLRELVGNPQAIRWAFFHKNMPEAELETYRAQMGDESFRAIQLDLSLVLPAPHRVRKIPMLVLCGALDSLFSVEEERRTAAAYNAEFVVMSDTAHDIMLEATWRESAAQLVDFLKRKKL